MNLEQVKEKMESITYKKDLLNVFKIIYENETHDKYIINKNGVFIKLNFLHDSTVELIYNYLQSIEQEILKIDDVKQYYKNEDNKKVRLTHAERQLLKRNIRLDI